MGVEGRHGAKLTLIAVSAGPEWTSVNMTLTLDDCRSRQVAHYSMWNLIRQCTCLAKTTVQLSGTYKDFWLRGGTRRGDGGGLHQDVALSGLVVVGGACRVGGGVAMVTSCDLTFSSAYSWSETARRPKVEVRSRTCHIGALCCLLVLLLNASMAGMREAEGRGWVW